MSNDPGVASPNQAFPFMGYQSPKWADPFNYCKLLDALGVACEVANINVRLGTSATDLFAVLQGSGGGPTAGPRHDHASQAPAPGVSSVSQTANGHVFVSVSVDTALTRGRIIDVMPIVAPAAAVLEAEQRRQAMIALGSDLRLRFEDAGGQSLATYVLAPIDPEQHELAQETRLYAELFELPEGTARVILVAGRTILAERVASASAPVVEIIAPSGGGGLTAPLDIEWQASDADDGETWRVLGTSFSATGVRLPTLDMLPGSASGRFRVIASDGFLTGEAVTAARFTLPNTAPQAAIFGPESGSAFDRGQTVVLLGTAMDLEEGALSGQNLRWRSSLEGDLGTGNELLLRRLQPGTHEITLTAQDRDAAISATAIRVVIRGVTGPALPDDEDEATIRRLLLGEAEEEDSNRIVVVAAAVAAALVALAFLIARRRRRSG